MTCKQSAFTKMPGGRHAGKTLLEIDLRGFRDYVEWVAREWNPGDAVNVRRAARAYLRWFPVTPGPGVPEAGVSRYNRLAVEVNGV